jgi:3-hydroxyacyl-CoA dehydrogenase
MELMGGKPGQGPAIFLLRRAQGGEDRRHSRGHEAARHRQGRSNRRRHHGRRNLDELPDRRNPGDDHRDETGKRSIAGTGVVRKNYEASAAKGRFTAEQVDKAMGLLNPTLDFEALSDCDLIIEAVYEDMDVKKEVFGRLDADRQARRDPRVQHLLSQRRRDRRLDLAAQDVVGMHFFSPANIMKLLEVVRGAKTAPDVLLTAMRIGKKIRKVPVVAGVCHGFIGNRMLMPRQVEATKLLLEGASPEQSTRSMSSSGCRWARSRWPISPESTSAGTATRRGSRISAMRLCAIERWGQKKGAGFYDYDEKRSPSPSPVVQDIIEDFARKQGVERREISIPGDRRANHLSDGQRGREDPRGRHGSARVRHRRRLGLWLRLAGLQGRPDVLGRQSRSWRRSSMA